MKKLLGVFSGDCLIGVCGTPTTLLDYDDKPLHIGDIVIGKYYDKDFGTTSDFMTSVCNSDYINYGGVTVKYKKQNKTPDFVMGIADVSITKSGLAYENEDGELESGWLFEKVKSWEDCVEGEH